MKKSEVQTVLREVRAIERGEIAPGRVRKVTLLPDGRLNRDELNLTQDVFAELLGVSLATIRKWERGTGEPSGAAKTLLAVAKINPGVIREAVAGGK